MEENSELEEGEACYNEEEEEEGEEDDDDHHHYFDPDVTLSYIDDRIKHVLGHFQKDFEGHMTAENLGAKFGEYGSFLPAYKRSLSPSVWCQVSVPQKSCKAHNSPGSLPLEGSLQKIKSVRLQSNSCNSVGHNIMGPIMDIQEKHEPWSSLAQVADRCPSKDTAASARPGSLTGLRSLKVRIKVRSDDVAQRNAAIYNGLGLDDSPSSLSGDSLGQSERKSNLEDSPDNIIQVMTSSSVPGGLLLSPLPSSLLSLSRMEKLIGESEPIPSLNKQQECISKIDDEAALLQGNAHLSKDKERKLMNVHENQGELKHRIRRFDRDGKTSMNKNLEEVSLKVEKCMLNGLKCSPLSNSICNNCESMKVVGGVPKISCEVNEVGLKDISLVEKASGNKAVNSKNNVVNLKCDDSISGNKTTAPLKDYSDASKCEEDLHKKVLQNTIFHSENEGCSSSEKGQQRSAVNNKLKGQLSIDKTVVSKKDNLRAEIVAIQKDKRNAEEGVHSYKGKTDKLRALSGNKISDNQSSLLRDKNVERGYYRVTMAKASVDLQNEPRLNSQQAQPAVGKNSNGQLSGTKVETYGGAASAKDVPSLCPTIFGNGPFSHSATAEVAPVLIEDNWVCCDRCQKWRLLPFGLKPEQLPEKWLCSMLNWLPGMNQCDITEEETTAALNALYHLPVPQSQNHIDGLALSATTFDSHQLDENHWDSSRVMAEQGKKKQNLKGTKHASGSNSLFHVSKSLESKVPGTRINVDQKNYTSEPSLTRKSKVQHLIDAKPSRMKNKQKDDGGSRHLERSKKEDTNMEKVFLDCNSDFQNAHRTDVKNSQSCLSEDEKCDRKDGILSMKKHREQMQISSDRLFDIQRTRKDSSTKKRKMKEYNPNCQESALDNGVYVKEESCDIGLRKDGKEHIIEFERNFSSKSGGDGSLRKKVRMTPICLSGGRDCPVDVTEDVDELDKDWELKKHRTSGMSEQNLEGIESQQRDFGLVQASLAVAISNSKVSGNHKIKASCKEMNEYVIQSVSPLIRKYNNGAMSGFERVRKEKISTDQNLKSQKISTRPEDRDNTKQKFSSEPRGSQLCESVSNIKEQVGLCKNDSRHCSKQSHESRIKEMCNGNAEGFPSKESGMASTSDHKIKPKSMSNCPKSGQGMKRSRNEKNNKNTNNSAGKRSIGHGTETQLKDQHHSDLKMDALSNTEGKYGLQRNLHLNLEDENKVQNVQIESQSGRLKCSLNSGSKSKQTGKKSQDSHRPLPCSIDSEDMRKSTKLSVNCSLENGVNPNLGNYIPEIQSMCYLSASGPDGMESISMAADNILKDAKELRNYADRLKSSDFDFESNEAYFQAALKFLHGASLLETHNTQIGKHGEVSQVQFYHCTVELCRSCAEVYEKRQEMSAAALAYKCMEVAYMRIVYCKQLCLNRDWKELLARSVTQGANQTLPSDDINLNSQAAEDKAILSKGASNSAAGNQAVIAARNQPNVVWLLDFTQIVSSAMEASRKSHNALAAANITVEDTHNNREFFASVKRVIDFSYQDVEELVQLVHLALKSYSGFGGTRVE